MGGCGVGLGRGAAAHTKNEDLCDSIAPLIFLKFNVEICTSLYS